MFVAWWPASPGSAGAAVAIVGDLSAKHQVGRYHTGEENSMRIPSVCLVALGLAVAVPAAQNRSTLDIYVVDVE